MKEKILKTALEEYFVHETPDAKTSNPKVLDYFAKSGNSWVKDDTNNAWCSAFIGFICDKLGLPKTGSLLARSWLKMGKETKTPEMGDLVIFWRDSIESGHGHVAIFIKNEGTNIVCLGGNQSDEVNIARYPAERVLGYRDISLEEKPGPAPAPVPQPSPIQPTRGLLYNIFKLFV